MTVHHSTKKTCAPLVECRQQPWVQDVFLWLPAVVPEKVTDFFHIFFHIPGLCSSKPHECQNDDAIIFWDFSDYLSIINQHVNITYVERLKNIHRTSQNAFWLLLDSYRGGLNPNGTEKFQVSKSLWYFLVNINIKILITGKFLCYFEKVNRKKSQKIFKTNYSE